MADASKKTRTLIVYYSRTGITKKVVETLREALGADAEEIRSKVDYSGFTGYMKGGRNAMKKAPTDIEPLKSDIAAYDLVVIGMPVWVYTIPPPVRSFMESYGKKAKRVAFFLTRGSKTDSYENLFPELEAASRKADATMSLIAIDVKKDRCAAAVKAFAGKLME